MDIGVFGGTFDPIHLGHLAVAEDVRYKLGLDEIIFVPAGQPWLKAGKPISPAAHRLQMVSLAIVENPHFTISTIEIDRSGPSYTVDTIATIKRQYGAKVKIYFILGGDALAELSQWNEPSRLIQMCQLVAFNRPGATLPPLALLESSIPGISQRVSFVEVSQVDIGATQIRQRVALGQSIHQLVPEAVERYILEQGLYAEAKGLD